MLPMHAVRWWYAAATPPLRACSWPRPHPCQQARISNTRNHRALFVPKMAHRTPSTAALAAALLLLLLAAAAAGTSASQHDASTNPAVDADGAAASAAAAAAAAPASSRLLLQAPAVITISISAGG